jgi:hypothetical protein
MYSDFSCCAEFSNTGSRETEDGTSGPEFQRIAAAAMDPKLTEVNQMFARFKVAYARNDLNACETLLSQLKVRARRLCWISPFPFHT